MRALIPGLFAAVLLLVVPASAAGAAPTFRPCPDAARFRCATVPVPLDRAGTVPGTVRLRVARLVRPGKPVLLYLSGGPGGAGVSEMLGVLGGLPELVDRFTLVGYDQRGTGRSGVIRCAAMQDDERVRSTRAAARCAQTLGARRSFYTTPDSVADIESIRTALGVRRMTVFGISYGTELGLAYARAHPERVDRLLLDSVVDADDTDPFGLAGFRAMPWTLARLCPQGCRGLTPNPGADLSRLTAALRAEPLRGRVYDAAGRGRTRTLEPVGIADLMYDGDYVPWIRAAIPAAVRAALGGDPAPLLRLETITAPLALPESAVEFSSGRYSTVCETTPLPWPPATPPADRKAVARAAATALGPRAFFPFDAGVAFADEVQLCLRWPVPVRPPAPPAGPYPRVRTLLLQGLEDLRTPPSASAAVAARLPRSQRVVVPGVGHAVVSADPSGCGNRRLLAFLDGRRVAGRCPRVPTGVPPAEVPPVSFADLDGVGGLPLRVGRTLRALAATLRDVGVMASIVVRAGGLRGGSFSIMGRGLVMRDVVVVPGVRVSGRLRATGIADLQISGSAAAHGRVRLEAGRLSGNLGGRDLTPPESDPGPAGAARAARAGRAVVGAGAVRRVAAVLRAGRARPLVAVP